MNDMELVTDVPVIEMELDVVTRNYPVIPNPEGTPTDDISSMEIDNVIYAVKDEEARTELEDKVDKVEGKDLSTNDFTNALKSKLDDIEAGAEVNVQVDWFENDNSKDDFIKNKPTKLSDFDNDEGFIDNSVNDLENYYTKSETYTKTEINSALNGKADKSDTYTKSEVDSALENKVNKDGDKVLSDNNYSDTDKSKLDGIEAEANKTVVDNSVTSTSTNPVESKAIYNLLNDLLPEATATGNPIAITNASGLNAKSLKVELEPIQDLHGYDSPWVGGGGKNKFNKATSINGYRINAEGLNYSAEDYFVSDYIPAIPNTQYSVSFELSVYTPVAFYDENKTFIRRVTSGNIIADSNAKYLRLANLITDKDNTQIEIGATSTSYAPYSNICPISGRTQTTVSVNSEDTAIQFGQTVYGGEVDVTSGGTSDKYGFVDLGSLDWGKATAGTYPRFYSNGLKNIIKPPVSSISLANVICTNYPQRNFANVYQANEDKVFGITDQLSSAYGNINVIDSSYSTPEAFKTAMSGVKLCYELVTPATINTPANEISLLKGSNTITGDGDMELIYSKIPQ